MARPPRTFLEVLRTNAAGLGAAAALVVLAAFTIHWIASNRNAPPPRKVVRMNVVSVQTQTQPARPPPPPPTVQPKAVEQPETHRVELKPNEIVDTSRAPPTNAPSGATARLALAAEASGPGDSFGLEGKASGGRDILADGVPLGDGSGSGIGDGSGDGAGARFAWYAAKIGSEIQDAFRKQRKLTTASARVELRIWADVSGRIDRVQLIRSTGNPDLDEAIQSIVGLRLRQPPPADLPMPLVYRFIARRPG